MILCHSDCDDRVGCTFVDENTSKVCDDRTKGFVVDFNDTHEVVCCRGAPYKKVVIHVLNVDSSLVENLIREVRVVTINSKPATMMIDVFEK